jgi:hypothetical protein
MRRSLGVLLQALESGGDVVNHAGGEPRDRLQQRKMCVECGRVLGA